MTGFYVEFLNGVLAILTLSIKYNFSISALKCIIVLGVNSLNKLDLRCNAENKLFTHVHRKAIRRRRKDESKKTKRRKRKDESEKTKAKRRKRKDESEKTKAKRRKDESEKTLNSGLQGAN